MEWPADLAPARLAQPDQLSCGATSAVVARMLLRPDWRPDDVAATILATHRRLTGMRDERGELQVPWPRGLGTPPWALARELRRLTGQRVRVRSARTSPHSSWEELVRRASHRPTAVYIGSRWLPRHVVLTVAGRADGSAVRIFDPAQGRLLTLPRGRWFENELGIAGWSHPWFLV